MKPTDNIPTIILLQNNSPMSDFGGLSPIAMYHLLYNPLGDKSPVQFRDNIDDETLDQIPLFRIAEEYLKIVQRDKQIKLTPLGALPRKVVIELYDKKFLTEDHIEQGIIKLWREEDSIAIRCARLIAGFAGFVKKANGKITLTKAGAKLLETNNRLQIFKQFFKTFTDKFLWSFNDGYIEEPVGQLGWAFSVIMLDKFGDQPRTASFYADKYLKAFPKFITFFYHDYTTVERQFLGCYAVRTFDRFFLWFGLVTVDKKKAYPDLDNDEFKRTDLVKSIFKIDV